jgi:hypothetical protein
MKYLTLLFISSLLTSISFAQETFDTYPKTFTLKNDSIAIRWGLKGVDKYKLPSDSSNYNDGALPGAFFVLFYNNDSIVLPYKNKIPFGQYTYFNFKTPSGIRTIRLGFDEQPSIFTEQDILAYSNTVQFDIPEVYELANIIWALSPSGQRSKDLQKESSYYQKLVTYFKPYLDHPVFKLLDFPDSVYTINYFDFRENSFAFNFANKTISADNTELLYNGPYYYVYGYEDAYNSLFGKLKPLVEDFAKKSKFRKFYAANQAYYAQQIQRQKELLPIRQMWTWLEQQFPATTYQSYRVVFSPLIWGSHSTQNYSTYKVFSQCVMFICNADRVDNQKDMPEKIKEGIMSGIVFTEIDHNYVNRVSNKYKKTIDSIFSDRIKWAATGKGNEFYGSPMNVFNEYMTWSVFCLYVLDFYNKADAEQIIHERETRMVDKRNFIRFKEFNRALIQIRKEHPGLKVVELYPFILDWCKQ